MLYRLLWPIVRGGVRVLYRTRWIGADRVPEQGPVILAGNHVSYLDPVVLAVSVRRPVSFMAKSELFEIPLFGAVLRAVHAFPVRRGTADREAISRAFALLAEGGALGIFPEGTRMRSAPAAEGQEGAAFLAIRNQAPIVPVGIHGTGGVMPPGARFPRFPRVTIVFGEPVHPGEHGGGSRRERIESVTRTVMDRIRHAVEEASRVR